MKGKINETYKKVSNFNNIVKRRMRLIKLNRNFLVFLIFLCISIGFWFLQTLKETTTVSHEYTLNLIGTPKDVIFTSNVPAKIKVNLTGRGYNFLNYLSKSNNHAINVNYEDLEVTDNRIIIDNTVLKRNLARNLGSGLKISSISPSQIDVYYSKGQAKNVPIIFSGKIKTGIQHVLCGIELLSDSAKVYVPYNMHDSIQAVATEYLSREGIEDTTIIRVALKKIEGVKIIPDSVDVRVCVDLFTEKTISVPIYCENIPRNKVLRTFPGKVDVTFRVSATMFNDIKEEQFLMVVDFNSIKQNDKSCKVELRETPEGVSHVRFKPENVEFVIELEDN